MFLIILFMSSIESSKEMLISLISEHSPNINFLYPNTHFISRSPPFLPPFHTTVRGRLHVAIDLTLFLLNITLLEPIFFQSSDTVVVTVSFLSNRMCPIIFVSLISSLAHTCKSNMSEEKLLEDGGFESL